MNATKAKFSKYSLELNFNFQIDNLEIGQKTKMAAIYTIERNLF